MLPRLVAVALLFAFSFPLITPALLADGAAVEPAAAQLPACCKRTGKHHCAMPKMAAKAAAGLGMVSAASQCPLYPKGHQAPPSTQYALQFAAPPASWPALLFVSESATAEQAETLYRVSFSRALQKRGPPSFLS